MTDPETGSRSYDVSRFDLGRETQRLRMQALLTWPKEAHNRDWYGLRDGMSVLELGSGPGFVTKQLLDLLPSSATTAIEIAPEMIARAKTYLGAKDENLLRILQGNILAMELPENTFDFAIARFLYQHLPDPVAAAHETQRLLRPGGKFVVAVGAWVVVFSRLTSVGPGLVTYFLFGFTQGRINVALNPLLLHATLHSLVGCVVAVLEPAVMLASVFSMLVAALLVSTALRGFHAVGLGLRLGPMDTIYLFMGLLTLAAGWYAMVRLRSITLVTPEEAAESAATTRPAADA